MTVSGIESLGFTPYTAPVVGATTATSQTTAVSAPEGPKGPSSFGDILLDSIDRLEGLQDKADQLSVQAATGDLNAIHDYTVAATEANVTTQLTMAVRNQAISAFNEIMRMQF